MDTGDDHGAGDTLAAAVASALAHGYSVPDAVAFAKSWVTECLRAAYPLGHGHGPVSPLFRLSGVVVNLDEIAGIAHEPDGKPTGVVVLTHGAGGSRESALLKKICDEWARRGLAGGALQPALPQAPAEGPAVRDRRPPIRRASSRRSSWRARWPRPGHRGRAFLRRPDDVDGGRRGHARRRADVVLLSAASARQARKAAHRTPAADRGADGVHPRHLRSVRLHRRAARGRGADSGAHRSRRDHRRPTRPRLQDARCARAGGRPRRYGCSRDHAAGLYPPPDQPPPPGPYPPPPPGAYPPPHRRRGVSRRRRRTTRPDGAVRAADARHQLVGRHLVDLRCPRRRPDQRGLRHRRAEPGQEGPGRARDGDRGPGAVRALGARRSWPWSPSS